MSASLPDTQDLAAAKSRRSVNGLLYFSFPRRCGGSGERNEPIGAPMPHAALWAVQPSPTRFFEISLHCFNAARGFVCGAALHQRQNSRMKSGFNVARGFVGGAANQEEGGELLRVVSMPHAALWVVQPDRFHFPNNRWEVSMPHAALWVVQQRFALSSNVPTWTFQCRTRLCGWCSYVEFLLICKGNLFQCRTRLCGWCSFIGDLPYHVLKRFQCRTRLCGWCSPHDRV